MLNYLLTAALLTASAAAAPIDLTYGTASTEISYAKSATGCGKSQKSGYSGPFTINSGGLSRSYKVLVPSNYNANTKYSLIFDYGMSTIEHLIARTSANSVAHGRGGTSNNQYDNSQYYNYSASSKYIVVYPQGVEGSNGAAWQGPSYADKSVDDIKFTADLLTQVKADYCINSDKVYASGKSNGAGFVDTLACSDTGDQFAAFAMAAAALYTDTSKSSCSKKRAILESHGDSDNTIPYDGGDGSGGELPKIGTWVRWWGERNCGSGATSSRVNKDGYHITSFGCGSSSTKSVKHYHLYEPAAHCWPDAKADNSDAKSISACKKSKVLDFTPVVLDWFGQWNLGNAPS